jgi:hypothetical protein
MSRFFVGQLVRVVGCTKEASRHFIGREGRVIELVTHEYWGDGAAVDIPGTNWFIDDHLVPSIPDGHRASEHTFHQLMDLLTAGEVANV